MKLWKSVVMKSITWSGFPHYPQGVIHRPHGTVENWVCNFRKAEDFPHFLFSSTKRFTDALVRKCFLFCFVDQFYLFSTGNGYYYGVFKYLRTLRSPTGGNPQ